MSEVVCTLVRADRGASQREKALAKRSAAVGYDLWRIGGGEGTGKHGNRDGSGRYTRVVWELWEEGIDPDGGVGGTFDIRGGIIDGPEVGFWPSSRGDLDLIEEEVAEIEAESKWQSGEGRTEGPTPADRGPGEEGA